MPNSGSHSPIKHIIWWVKVCFLFGCVCGASHPPLSECFKWDAVSWCKSSIVGKWILNIFFLGHPMSCKLRVTCRPLASQTNWELAEAEAIASEGRLDWAGLHLCATKCKPSQDHSFQHLCSTRGLLNSKAMWPSLWALLFNCWMWIQP